MTKRAVILARGLGTRMRREDEAAGLSGQQAAVAGTGVKGLIPVGRPFLDYVISALADAGITEVCLVVAPGPSALRDRYGALHGDRVRIAFAVQEHPRGTADAVLAAETWAAGEAFVVVNSDNYYPVETLARLAATDEPALVAFSRSGLLAGGQIASTRLASFAVLELDGDYLARIVEKPGPADMAGAPSEAWVSMNCWRFDARIFAACRDVSPSPRGELELPLAVGLALARNEMRVRAVRVDAQVLDLSSRADIAAVAMRLANVEVRL